ncbi:MAG: DUF4097 family beta strand repeat protein [Phycisphaerae bacterium]|nr:DUF4097 family beta strand repeat protein [Phycisphaerae bacterium]
MREIGMSILASILVLLAGCISDTNPYAEKATADFSETRSEDITTLKIDWPIGDVTIVVDSDADEVTIEGVITAYGDTTEDAEANLAEFSVELVESESDSDVVTLSISGTTSEDWFGGADVEIELPDGVVLEIEVGTGDVTITGNTEDVDVIIASGDLMLSEIEGNIDIDLEDGDIEMTTVEGDIQIEQSSGNLTIDDLSGELDIVAGDVDVVVSVSPPDEGTVAIDVVTGSIDLTIPMDFEGDLDLETAIGVISGSLEGFSLTNTVAEPDYVTPTHISATMNGGGGVVTAETTLGDITIAGM